MGMVANAPVSTTYMADILALEILASSTAYSTAFSEYFEPSVARIMFLNNLLSMDNSSISIYYCFDVVRSPSSDKAGNRVTAIG